MDNIHQAYDNLFKVLDQLRLTGAERRQLVGDLNLLFNTAKDSEEVEEADGGTD